jgi:hypothetical protein
MIKILKSDLDTLSFDGIVVGIPKTELPDRHNDISFVVECNFYTNGKHGYKEPGFGCDTSSFYHVCYNMDNLPNGLWMNSTSRFTIEQTFNFEYYNYYKFDNMLEFCNWYVNNTDVNDNGKAIPKKQKRRYKYASIVDYIERYVKLALSSREPNITISQLKPLYDNVENWLDTEE